MLFLLLACHRNDDSAGQGRGAAAYDCVPLEQPGPDGTTVPSGYEYCAVDDAHGFVHRVFVVDSAVDPTQEVDSSCEPVKHGCSNNAECPDGSVCESARCGQLGCGCTVKCKTDADCGPDHACVPDFDAKGISGFRGNYECVPADCSTDADCPSQLCAVSPSTLYADDPRRLQCFGPNDECTTSADCEKPEACLSYDGSFRCLRFDDCDA